MKALKSCEDMSLNKILYFIVKYVNKRDNKIFAIYFFK